MATQLGLDSPMRLHATDRLEDIRAQLEAAADCDVVVVTGGVSAGNYDLVPQAILNYGAEIIFHKVRQKPGKPLLFARRGNQLLFGLPGNPLSCHFCFHRYVTAAVRKAVGDSWGKEPMRGRLTFPLKNRGERTWFVTARATWAPDEDAWSIGPLPGVTSADVFATCCANCYVEIPAGDVAMNSGDLVPFTWMGMAPWNE
jgi:molybdopterin molybdotransferase